MSSEMKAEDTGASEGSRTAKKGGKRPRQTGAMSRLRRSVSHRDPMAVLVFEQRLLVAATIGILIALILWIVAVSTDYWFHVTAPTDLVYQNRTKSFFVRSHSGLWTICKYSIFNESSSGPVERTCHNHRLFPTLEQIEKNPEIDRTILDYTRTETAFAIITFCLMFMGMGFSLYTFKEQRYMFKRLAGGVHFITAAAVLVVIEVVVNSVQYEEQFLNARHPKGAQWSYGYSFIVACFCFIIMLLVGAVFLICSRKRKGERAAGFGSGDDEPHILGRM